VLSPTSPAAKQRQAAEQRFSDERTEETTETRTDTDSDARSALG
jgi:hypothetical protein